MFGNQVQLRRPLAVGAFAVLLVLFGLVVPARTTPQDTEDLEMDGIEYSILDQPLEPYIETLDHRPHLSGLIVTVTSNWRGYRGSWKILHDSLFLIKLQMLFPADSLDHTQRGSDWRDAPIELYFPGRRLPIFADWYTGTITLPCGEMIKFQGMATRFEQEFELDIRHGEVSRKFMLDLTGLGNFRSFDDYRICGPLSQVVDTGEWLDLRWVCTEYFPYPDEETRRYKIRGLLLPRESNGTPYLTLAIPETPVTLWDRMSFDQFPDVNAIPESSRVECSVVHTNDDCVITSIRLLEKNESIYARNYPEMLRRQRREHRDTIPWYHHR